MPRGTHGSGKGADRCHLCPDGTIWVARTGRVLSLKTHYQVAPALGTAVDMQEQWGRC